MDGEYNKYPKYHGCLRFDDDNIVEVDLVNDVIDVKYNGVSIIPDMPIINSNILDISGESFSVKTLYSNTSLAYIVDPIAPGVGENIDGISITRMDNNSVAYAIKEALNKWSFAFMATAADHDIYLYLNKPPVSDGAVIIKPQYTISLSKLHILCNFDSISSDNIETWGLTGADIQYNVPFPSALEFLADYGGLT